MNKHDASYRLLFSNPTLVRSLFHGIIDAPWLDMLNWNRLEALPTDYISDKLHQRQGDIVWRLPRRRCCFGWSITVVFRTYKT